MSRVTAGPDHGAAAPSLALLSLASSLSPFGMIVVVPTLQSVTQIFGVGHGKAQFLIAAYLIGLGVGQPVVGYLADRFGRRPVILVGFTIFTLASVACAVVSTFDALVAARFVQALGVSVGTVGSRAIVRDTHDAIGSARALAWIGAAMGVAPVVGPVIGGTLGSAAGPGAVFWVSAGLGLATTIALYRGLVETRTDPGSAAAQLRWWVSYRQLLGSRVFLGYTLMYAFIQGCFFSFLAVGAAVFDDHLGLDQQHFGLAWGAMGLVYIASAAAASRLTARIGMRPALLAGTICAVGGAAGMLAAAGLGTVTLAGLLLPLMVLMVAAGIQSPLSVAGAVNCRPDISGTASGLSSSLALASSGAFSILAGTLYSDSFTPIALLIAASATLTAGTYLMSR